MGSLFEMLSETTPSPLKAAATVVVWDALFHEEHLEGYREAFAAAAASAANSASSPSEAPVVKTAASGEASAIARSPAAGDGGKKKRRRKSKDGDGGDAGGSGGVNAPRRACYHQQLLEEMNKLARSEHVRSRLGAIAGAPLLLEGFIVRLERTQHASADIHEAASVASAAAISAGGGKRSRSSASASNASGGGGTSSSASPASQMFKLWAVLTSTLAGSALSAIVTKAATERSTVSGPAVVARGHGPRAPPSLVVPFLRASNSMLGLLAAHDVYRINEDWGGAEFDQLKRFSSRLICLAASGGGTSGDDDASAAIGGNAARVTPAADGQREVKEAAQEFVQAFSLMLGLNHNILHDDLRPVLRMTFEWAATGVVPTAATSISAVDDEGTGMAGGDHDDGRDGYLTLRALAVGLVVNLVDTYGRLRQIDHLVQALFGAIVNRPSATAAVLKGEECTAALARYELLGVQ